MKYLVLTLVFALNFNLKAVDTISTVDSVNLEQYLGLWHEIARLPNSFQDDDLETPCYNTTAEYKKGYHKTIKVKNSCRYLKDGVEKVSVGKARATIKDKKTNAKLSVNFIPIWKDIPFLNKLASGAYWVSGLGPVRDGQYSWAVVISPKKNKETGDLFAYNAWVLAREKDFASTSEFSDAQEILEQNGLFVEDFVFSQK